MAEGKNEHLEEAQSALESRGDTTLSGDLSRVDLGLVAKKAKKALKITQEAPKVHKFEDIADMSDKRKPELNEKMEEGPVASIKPIVEAKDEESRRSRQAEEQLDQGALKKVGFEEPRSILRKALSIFGAGKRKGNGDGNGSAVNE